MFPEDYLTEMSKHDTYVDALFLNGLAQMLGHDIVLVHMHEDSVANGLFNWMYGGGDLGNGSPSQSCPLFLSIYQNSLIFIVSIFFQCTLKRVTTRPATSSQLSPPVIRESST